MKQFIVYVMVSDIDTTVAVERAHSIMKEKLENLSVKIVSISTTSAVAPDAYIFTISAVVEKDENE